ncbi:CpsB/CapC family capsule biosynthesis tyrosine phosphatase [Shouchella patagoniensis]|uniref:CpsB/CapC family capsule biosynthesis tyrosine phosphatase n=1 Tax=Shouchella patagoniensis TaxID=228576 RepID=UPI0009959F04|nr:CpsB/CapC family capsule biosynthesis tyrosine phosphatase [Shouchella patagoniensis]
MFDISNYLLPFSLGVSRAKSRTLEHFSSLLENGIHSLCYAPYFDETDTATWGEAVQRVVNNYKAETTFPKDFSLVAGHTLKLSSSLRDDLHEGKALPLSGTAYVLIDVKDASLDKASNQLYELALGGYMPILLHPERDQRFQKDPAILYRMVKNGSYTLMQAASLLGVHGKQAKKCAQLLIKSRLIHMVASYEDSPTKDELDLVKIEPFLKKVDPSYGEALKMNLMNLLEGRPGVITEPMHPEKKRLSFFS